ncbi:cuticle protein 8-like isoform X2 [Periplaneta americana]|uniref:cuticle protein 8-like isoform X2 n=1 Tax=Periplaneta americana TaxID=6978 RepID=UPI0037E8E99A
MCARRKFDRKNVEEVLNADSDFEYNFSDEDIEEPINASCDSDDDVMPVGSRGEETLWNERYGRNMLSGVFAALVAAVLAQDHHHQLPVAEHHVEEHHYAHPKYEFKYGVKDPHTHDIKEQAEKRDGHKVESHYMLVEPDGTIRTVQYTADKHTGFHAHVQRSGHAVHPTH